MPKVNVQIFSLSLDKSNRSNSLENRPSSEANRSATSQTVLRSLRNLKLTAMYTTACHLQTDKSSPQLPVLFLNIHFTITFLSKPTSSLQFHHTRSVATRATCCALVCLLALIVLITTRRSFLVMQFPCCLLIQLGSAQYLR